MGNRCAGALIARQRQSLCRAGVHRWRQRMQPRTSHAADRAGKPHIRGLSTVSPSSWVWDWIVFGQRSCRVLSMLRVQKKGVPAFFTFLPAFHTPTEWARGAVFCITPRIQRLWRTVWQGLGGLVTVKLRYKGKSFKWHHRRGSLMLRFGHSHLVAAKAWPGIRWRRQGRMKILLFGSSLGDLTAFTQKLCEWRPQNVYHGRGLRLRRQWILRKSGKVSAYR